MYVPVSDIILPDEDDFCISEEFSCNCKECNQDCPCINRFSNSLNQGPSFECNSFCKCEKCSHKNIISGKIPELIVKKAGGKGLGVFANEMIEKGRYVGQYCGVYSDDIDIQGEFVYQIVERTPKRVISTCIDAGYFGNYTRFINHSCNPNLETVPIRVNYILPNLAFFAIKDIQIGEEICFRYRDKVTEQVCLCGSENCFGFF